MAIVSDKSPNNKQLVVNGNTKVTVDDPFVSLDYQGKMIPENIITSQNIDNYGTIGASNEYFNVYSLNVYQAPNKLPNTGAAWLFSKKQKTVQNKKYRNVYHTQEFDYTGSDQLWQIPNGVNKITAELIGAGGGGNTIGTHKGGNGAYVRATVLVNSGETIRVVVGQGGIAGGTSAPYGGGGYLTSTGYGGSGGGRTALVSQYGDFLTAGGGGGAGIDGPGGHGGSVAGDGVTNGGNPLLQAKGANKWVVGYFTAEQTINYKIEGASFSLQTKIMNPAVSLPNYLNTKTTGDNASSFNGTTVCGNGAGGGGFAGGAAGPSRYGYRATAGDAYSYTIVNGSGSGGSSFAENSYNNRDHDIFEEIYTNVILQDGNNRQLPADLKSYGVGGNAITAGSNGKVIIHWVTKEAYYEDEEKITWNGGTLITAPDADTVAYQLFGQSVALYDTTIAIGAPGNNTNGIGNVFIYTVENEIPVYQQRLVSSGTNSSNGLFGAKVIFAGPSLFVYVLNHEYDSNGVNQVTNAGAIYEFRKVAGSWVQHSKITPTGTNSRLPGDQFGYEMAVYGNTLLVTSNNGYDPVSSTTTNGAGTVWVYTLSGGEWILTQRLVGDRIVNARFGSSLSIKSDLMVIGSSESSQTYIYRYDSENSLWELEQKITDSNTSNSKFYTYANRINPISGLSGDWNYSSYGFTSASGQNFASTTVLSSFSPWAGPEGDFMHSRSDFSSLQFVVPTLFAKENNFTFETWIHINSALTIHASADGKVQTTNSKMGIIFKNYCWALCQQLDPVESNAGILKMVFLDDAGTNYVYEIGKAQVLTWLHVAVVREGNELRTFINGRRTHTYDVTGITFKDIEKDPTNSSVSLPVYIAKSIYEITGQINLINNSMDNGLYFSCSKLEFRTDAFYNADFTPSNVKKTADDNITNNQRGRGLSSYIVNSNLILDALPYAISYQPYLSQDREYDRMAPNPQAGMSRSGYIEELKLTDSGWNKKYKNFTPPDLNYNFLKTNIRFGSNIKMDDENIYVLSYDTGTNLTLNGTNTLTEGRVYVLDKDTLSLKTSIYNTNSHAGIDNSYSFATLPATNSNAIDITYSDTKSFETVPVIFQLRGGYKTNDTTVGIKEMKGMVTYTKKSFVVDVTTDGASVGQSHRPNTVIPWGNNNDGNLKALSPDITNLNAKNIDLYYWSGINGYIYGTPSGIEGIVTVLTHSYENDPATSNKFYIDTNATSTTPIWGDSTTSGTLLVVTDNESGLIKTTQQINPPGTRISSDNSSQYFGRSFAYDDINNEIFISTDYANGTPNFVDAPTFSGRIERFKYLDYKGGWESVQAVSTQVIQYGDFAGKSIAYKNGKLVFNASGAGNKLTVYNRNETTGDLEVSQTITSYSIINDSNFIDWTLNGQVALTDDASRIMVGSLAETILGNANVGRLDIYDLNTETDQYAISIANLAPSGALYPDRETSFLGTSVRVYNDKIYVGAPATSKTAMGTITPWHGAVYVYDKQGTDYWNQVNVLREATPVAYGQLGLYVDIDDNAMVIGASSKALTYSVVDDAITFRQTISTTNNNPIAVFDNNSLLVGDPANTSSIGRTRVLDYGSVWTEVTDFRVPVTTNLPDLSYITYNSNRNIRQGRAPYDTFGTTLTFNSNGDLIVGAPGQAYNVDGSYNGGLGALYFYYFDESKNSYRLSTKATNESVGTTIGFNVIPGLENQYLVRASNNNLYLMTASQPGYGGTITFENYKSSVVSEQGISMQWDNSRELFYVGAPAANYFMTYNKNDSAKNVSYTLATSGAGNNRRPYELFGRAVDVQNGFLVISAPGYDRDFAGTTDSGSAGALFTYRFNSAYDATFIDKITFEGTSTQGNGTWLALSDNKLLTLRNTIGGYSFDIDQDYRLVNRQPLGTLSGATVSSITGFTWNDSSESGFISTTNGSATINGLSYTGGLVLPMTSSGATISFGNNATIAQSINYENQITPIQVKDTTDFGTAVTFNSDATKFAILDSNDPYAGFNRFDRTDLVAGLAFNARVNVYEYSEESQMYRLASWIRLPTSNTAVASINWIDDKIMVTLSTGVLFFKYFIDSWYVDDVESSYVDVNTASFDGTNLFVASNILSGYPQLASSGGLTMKKKDGSIWTKMTSQFAGSDAIIRGTTYEGGGGGAGYYGGASGISLASAQGGINLLPDSWTQVNSYDYQAANKSNTNALGAGGSTTAADGQHGRIVISYGSNVEIFDFTGQDQEFVVPSGVTELEIEMWGAGGGASYSDVLTGYGGAGSYISGTLQVTPNETLTLVVGGGGKGGLLPGASTTRDAMRVYGFGGIGVPSTAQYGGSGGGGGLAGIKQNGVFVAIAAGGGGASKSAINTSMNGLPGGMELEKRSNIIVNDVIGFEYGSENLFAPGAVNTRLANDYFGSSLAIDNNNKIYIGVPGHEFNNDGISIGVNIGSIFEYNRVNGYWDLTKKINSSYSTNDNFFAGGSLTLHDNKLTVVSTQPIISLAASTVEAYVSVSSTMETLSDTFESLNYGLFNDPYAFRDIVVSNFNNVIAGTASAPTNGIAPSKIASGAASVFDFDNINEDYDLVERIIMQGYNYGRVAGDRLGTSVLIQPNSYFAGAPDHDYSLDELTSRSNQGAVYKFDRLNNDNYLTKHLQPSTVSTGFGKTIELIGDKIFVGVYDNSLYSFNLTDWSYNYQIAPLADGTLSVLNSTEVVELVPNGSRSALGYPVVEEAGYALISNYDNTGTLTEASLFVEPGTSNGRKENDNFGLSVHAGLNFIAVGSKNNTDENGNTLVGKNNSIYTFERTSDSSWKPEIKLTGKTFNTGIGYSISGKDSWMIAGGWNATNGTSVVYQRVASKNWQVRNLIETTDNEQLGNSVFAISTEQFLTGAPLADSSTISSDEVIDSGKVIISTRTGLTFANEEIDPAGVSKARNNGDWFGYHMDSNKNYVVIGSPNYDFDSFGIDDGKTNTGCIWIYRRVKNDVELVQRVSSPNRVTDARFGYSVAIDPKTNRIAVGEPGTNLVHVFKFNGGSAVFVETLSVTLDTNEIFGETIAMNAGYIIVGAKTASTDAANVNPLTDAGAVYVFKQNGLGTYDFVEKLAGVTDINGDLTLNGRNANDLFGFAVDISDNGALIVGIPQQDYNAEGTDQVDNSGAVYFKKL